MAVGLRLLASHSQKPTWVMQNDRIIIITEWFGVEGTWIIQFYPLPWAGMDWGGGGHTPSRPPFPPDVSVDVPGRGGHLRHCPSLQM